MEKKTETYVGKIIKDFNKDVERKAYKRESTYLSFAIRSVAREQEKNILVSRLRRDLKTTEDNLSLLQMEIEVKESLIKLKDSQLESLKDENEKLLLLLNNNKEEKSTKKENIVPNKIGSTSNPAASTLTDSNGEISEAKKPNLKRVTNTITSLYNLRKKSRQK